MKNEANQSTGKQYWRSLDELAQSPAFVEKLNHEFPMGASELGKSGLNRRAFLGLMGASMALAGVSMSGCIRKPVEKILPYTRRPEDLIPGKPKYYATAMQSGGGVLGILVESHEGRPTKIEGNPMHPMSMGGTNAWAQAAVLEMYDPERSQTPLHQGKKVHWDTVTKQLNLDLLFETLRKTGGEGFSILMTERPSPTFHRLLKEVQNRFPKATFYRHDLAYQENQHAGLRMVGHKNVDVLVNLDKADVVLSLDADFLGVEGDVVSQSRHFTDKRRLKSEKDSMNRLYAVEAIFSVTGINADHRLRLKSQEIGSYLISLTYELIRMGVPVPTEARELINQIRRLRTDRNFGKWVSAVAKDLVKHRGKSAVIVGERQPDWVHALAYVVNAVLGNLGRTIKLMPRLDNVNVQSLTILTAHIKRGKVQTLLMLGGNPVYDAPADLDFAKHLKSVKNTIHHSLHANETSQLATWHLPASHFLEAWGDLKAKDGTVSIQQPLIAPLYNNTFSDIEVLSKVLSFSALQKGYSLVRKTWGSKGSQFEKQWRRWLHDGVVEQPRTSSGSPFVKFEQLTSVLKRHEALTQSTVDKHFELNFCLDTSVFDGRYSNNGWLQELPDPVTKLTWDNAACISPKTADRLSVKNGDVLELSLKGRKMEVAAFVVPGVADNTVLLNFGYGRQMGKIATGTGVNAFQLSTTQSRFFVNNINVKPTNRTYLLASTQDYGSLKPLPTYKERPLVREDTLQGYRRKPNFVLDSELIPKDKIKSLWVEPNPKTGQQWGMSIDLNSCTGCNTCTIACQSENNIPIVGKQGVHEGRELHWMRIDRYYRGNPDNPQAVVQPVNCMQCETAPCESVCPVAATTHSPEGLNDMAYNRCIGTRYCSNNCPFKVRRFNYFNYVKDSDKTFPLAKMQRNPDVTVRFRGVMEKCTYCVQRIQSAKIDAKVKGKDQVEDGTIVPACAQACPTKAIVFGDVNDPKSEVSKLKRQNRDYSMLSELNLKPRTTYLARIRNPNPELI